MTRNIVDILEVKPEWVTILFDEYERGNWALAGELHSLKFEPAYGKQGADF